MLRVAVQGGGCSGFQYGFTLDDQRNDDDLALERDGVTVLIDAVSAEYLAGSEIDYVDDLIGSAFKINNPNATASCGCSARKARCGSGGSCRTVRATTWRSSPATCAR